MGPERGMSPLVQIEHNIFLCTTASMKSSSTMAQAHPSHQH